MWSRHKKCFSRYCERFHLIHSAFLTLTCWCFHLAPICQREATQRAGFRPDEWMPAAAVASAAEVRSIQTGSEASLWLADPSKQRDKMTDGIKARLPMVAPTRNCISQILNAAQSSLYYIISPTINKPRGFFSLGVGRITASQEQLAVETSENWQRAIKMHMHVHKHVQRH